MQNREIALIVDSCTDVPKHYVDTYGIYTVPLLVNYRDGSYLDRITITPQEVYDRFDQEIPTTSTPTLDSVKCVFKRVLGDGFRKAVVVTISSGLSATNEMMSAVARDFEGELETIVIDTKNIGMGAGLTAMRAARLIEQGVAFEDLEETLVQTVEDTKVFFCVDTLEYLHQGGRIGEVTYRVGSLLDMRPVISCNDRGVYYTVSKARGRKQSLKKALDQAVKFVSKFSRYNIAVVNGAAEVEAADVLGRLKERLPHYEEVSEGQISPVLVVHTGPGLIGIGVQGIR